MVDITREEQQILLSELCRAAFVESITCLVKSYSEARIAAFGKGASIIAEHPVIDNPDTADREE